MRVRWRARRNSRTIIYDDSDVSICGGAVEHFLCARSIDMLLRSFLVYHQEYDRASYSRRRFDVWREWKRNDTFAAHTSDGDDEGPHSLHLQASRKFQEHLYRGRMRSIKSSRVLSAGALGRQYKGTSLGALETLEHP